MTYEQILAAALKLDTHERANVAELLWITVAHPESIAAAWVSEAERRGMPRAMANCSSPRKSLLSCVHGLLNSRIARSSL
ncbi:MAG: addiction module protein [Dechloromonas sp.]|nr:MAG: addiction module protein [Dechloromonas sp.]